MTIQSILIANRGEIACRIIRSVQLAGGRAIAVYSDADRTAPHVAMADDAILIGPAPASESYLSIEKIVDAALQSGADAVHPGYGFLSENADFAQAVSDEGLIFIGPPAAAIAAMGNKAEAKRLMLAAGVPCVPGYQDHAQSDSDLQQAAAQTGYPVMIKAANGGGGRGMRLVKDESTLIDELSLARSEALRAFGSDELILERAVLNARHIELQIFADQQGSCVHLGERDCSMQRRHQKVIEEAPGVVITAQLRAKMGAAAVAAARAVSYVGAGTVEFLLDENEEFYFLEMNTRLQVEHPVTEMITGLDLVAMQIAVANGDALPVQQDDITFDGHAIEVRLYAEDPANEFLPDTGKIECWHMASPDLVRTDSGIQCGQEVSPFYDPMLAKIIAHGATREIARNKLIRGLMQTVLLGPVTNTGFLLELLDHADFIEGKTTTGFIAEHYPDGSPQALPDQRDIALIAALCLYREQQASIADAVLVADNLLGWSSAAMMPIPLALQHNDDHYRIGVSCLPDGWQVYIGDDEPVEVVIESVQGAKVRAQVEGRRLDAFFAFGANEKIAYATAGKRIQFRRTDKTAASVEQQGSGHVQAPMPGVLIALNVSVGQSVSQGETLAVLEAMKMQHRILATVDGIIEQLPCKEGDQLISGASIAIIDDGSSHHTESQ